VPAGSVIVVTVTQTGQPYQTGQAQPLQDPYAPWEASWQGTPSTTYTVAGDSSWTQPLSWGPTTTPYGPATPTGPQTIPTTTTQAPEEPVPYLTHCGPMSYVEDDVRNALTVGCQMMKKSNQKGGYPKDFQNDGSFNFGDVLGPYWEFPVIPFANYIGGNPGPDRVIFNAGCHLAGIITQNGDRSPNFSGCTEIS